MSDIQKLKDLMARYHQSQKMKGFDSGVAADDKARKNITKLMTYHPQNTKGYSGGGITADDSQKSLGELIGFPGTQPSPAPKPKDSKDNVRSYDDGGIVSQEDLKPYMPSKEEEESSGLPPGPQRASYIANKKYQAAQETTQGYSGGGPIIDPKMATMIQQSAMGSKPVLPTKSYTEAVGASDLDADNALDKPTGNVDMVALATKLNQMKQQPRLQPGYADGGIIDDDANSSTQPDELQQILDQTKDPEVSNTPVLKDDLSDLVGESSSTEPQTNKFQQLLSTLSANKAPESDTEESAEETKPKVTTPVSQDDNINTTTSSPAVIASPRMLQPNSDNNQQDLKAAQRKDALMGGIAQILGGSEGQQNYLKAAGAVNQLEQQTQAKAEQTKQALADYQLADEKEKNDPNSSSSVLARNILQSSSKAAGLNLGNISKLSASTIEKNFPSVAHLIDTQAQAAQRAESSKDRLALLQGQLGVKANDKQDKALQSAQTLLESARGNPAAAQAEKDLYSAQKANSLANLYGDPNKLSLPQVKLLAAEVGKIAAGGTSTQSELEGITPNTLVGKMSQYVTNLTNNPTPANAAAFVKQYQDYTGALVKDAQKVIQDKYGRVIESRKNQLGPDNYQSLQDQYINRFKTLSNSKTTQDPSSAPDVTAYAQQHKITPQQALAIKLSRTGQ